MKMNISKILAESNKRDEEFNGMFDPITGQNSIGKRTKVLISDFHLREQWLPDSMLKVELVRDVVKAGSIKSYLIKHCGTSRRDIFNQCCTQLVRIRLKHDFPFWAAMFAKIKNKEGGDDVLFRLRYPQRILVSKFEEKRLAGKPIRLVLLKARQWGGSTTTQLYMAWLQFFHKKGLNSLIIAHQGAASDEIRDMFQRMIAHHPVEFMHDIGEPFSPTEDKIKGVGMSGTTHRIPQRNCKIKVGTAERPDACRGGDYSLVHLSEVGLWKKTDGKSPEDIVRSACSGMLLKPLTMVVMESTANGTGNFFHSEYTSASNPNIPSQFDSLFIAWFQIEQNRLPFSSEEEKRKFAQSLYDNRLHDNALSSREQSGKYLWWLWERGATLEAINWYIAERAGKNSHAVMASEYPSDDVEAFVHSGQIVFDRYQVEALRKSCKSPKYTGDIVGQADEGKDALSNLHFVDDSHGVLSVWSMPEKDDDSHITVDRYLTVVDVGGRSSKADYSVIMILDRIEMIDGFKPAVVAQWYGHCDIDRLAWKAAQIAKFYNDSLLVIESNTLETHDRERQIEGGDQSHYILNQIAPLYDNLYARRQSEDEIRQGMPRKYGFHTNVSTKPMIISNLIRCVRDGLYIERDERCLHEYNQYEQKPNGSYGAIIGCHDDILMTRAIGLHICFNEMPMPKVVAKSSRMPTKRGPVSEASF